MGLLRVFRRLTRRSARAMTASFSELDSFFLPERRHQLDGVKSMKSMSVMRDDEDAGAPPNTVDLRAGTAVIKRRGRGRSDAADPAGQAGESRRLSGGRSHHTSN